MRIRKKGEQKKKSNKRYIEVKRKKGAGYYLTFIVVTAAFLASCLSIVIVDRNSRLVGWNQQRTEFAFSSTSSEFEFTVMGKEINVNAVPFRNAESVYSRIRTVYNYISPCPVRLTGMVLQVTGSKMGVYRRLLEKVTGRP